MNNLIVSRPEKNEYAIYYETYVSLVNDDDILAVLRNNKNKTHQLLSKISEEKSLHRYAEEKWSIRELLGHIIDAERIFAYRALRFARNDQSVVEGFEQNSYVESANFDDCDFANLIAEFILVRDGNVLMLQNLTADAWRRSGIASENRVSVRALAYIIAGHETHHMNILKERYLN